ncbi:amidase [Amphritea balenae]|uniref:Amidase n=1 Tax=Amphritea balenae TaxID=452629 RepID=A0A3P1SW35_9GAMM|nr:amidase [Amphritea balenae]RRD01427.1 amidase [Amphritea balenae]GGK57199.1 amidase [Amphritea balenae]
MNSLSLNGLSLRQALALIAEGHCAPVDVINACYDQIEARQADVGAWHFLLSREQYLQQYYEKEAFYKASLLQGLPIGIKDIIDTDCMPTEMGSTIHSGRQPTDNASCVNLLLKAGAIVPGKTVTTEFAYFKPGKTRNPKDLNRTPGGSSSGSAAAVADFMIPAAVGSQTAASVIRPAAYCGVVGYVGTRGEYSLRGVQPLAQSLDSLGLFSRRVEDIGLLRSILLQQPDTDLVKQDRPYRILVCKGSSVGESDPEMDLALEQFSVCLAQQGAELIEMHSCDLIRRLVEHHHKIMAWEATRNLCYEADRSEQVSEALQQLFELGRGMARETYLDSLQVVAKIGHWLWSNPDHKGVDAILAPAAPGVAPQGHCSTGQPHMSRPWQVLGLPVVTLPGMQDDNGLPLGLQFIGRAREDDQLLGLAHWAETVLS